MTKEDQRNITLAIIVAIALILLWLFVRKKPSALAQQMEGAAIPVVGGNVVIYPSDGISIPSIDFPPHEGPIVWPSFDTGGTTGGGCGISICGCDGTSTGLLYGNTYYGW